MKKFILLSIAIILASVAISQNYSIKGEIKSGGEAIPFVNIAIDGTNLGSSSDINGYFELKNLENKEYKLQISAVGYFPMNFKTKASIAPELLKVELKVSSESFQEVVITGTMKEMSMLESPVPVEVYTPEYFKKNPAPALFESLQIVNGVRPQLNCNVCNTGDIHINGMEGPYTMVLIDGMPVVGGLSSVYGLTGIPQSLVDRIEIIKGPASTLYGSEAVGGVINVITKSPENTPLVSIDAFGTSWHEYNTDIGIKTKMGKISNLTGINYFNYNNPIDNNNDNFTDVTLQNRVSVFNKTSIERKEKRVASIAARYVYENRWGGEMNWTPEFRGGDSIYAESIYTNRIELIGKYQLPLKENVFINASYSNHDQNSVYGDLPYIANEQIGFTQLLWNKRIKGSHDVLVGLNNRITLYDDNTPATAQPSLTVLPGVFIQDEIEFNKKNKILLGCRYDYHSKHGSILAPRINYKWTPDNMNTLRLSFGNGFRVVNLFTEDHAALTGAREVIIMDQLEPEKSYNVNANYTRFINTSFGFLNLELNPFYTLFTNKITPDYLTNDNQIIYDNLDGNATSRGISFSTDITFEIPLKINAGATLMEIFQTVKNDENVWVKERQLLSENFTATWTASYKFAKIKLTIDYTGNLYSPMLLPVLENDPRPATSPWFSLQNLQLTKTFAKPFEIYGGIKNLLNYTPPANSIMRAHDPFDKKVDDPTDNPNGHSFDPSYVFAPNQGRRLFFGVRYHF